MLNSHVLHSPSILTWNFLCIQPELSISASASDQNYKKKKKQKKKKKKTVKVFCTGGKMCLDMSDVASLAKLARLG